MIVAVDNVIQNPSSAFNVVGNSITFTSAPLSGTNNIWVEYTSLITTLQRISQDPTVIGDIRATGGYLAEGDFGNSFIDGAILDYVTGNARITTGPADGMTFYNGGTSGRNALMALTASGNVGIGTTNPARRLDVRGVLGMQVNEDGAGTKVISMRSDFAGIGPAINVTTNDPLLFLTNNTERMRIDSSGNVGIGNTAPNTLLYVRQATATGASTTGTNQCTLENNGAVGVSLITPTANQATIRHSTALDQTSSSIVFDGAGRFMAFTTVNGAERMRINNNGDLLIGTNANLGSTGRVNILSANANPTLMELRYNNAGAGQRWIVAIDSNNGYFLYNHNGVGVTVTNGATSWSAVSDERLKTDLQPIENALNKVNQLRSVTGRFKSDGEGTSRSFLIAQDVEKVLPEAVSPYKNPNSEDETEYLAVSYTDVIPLLVAAIKEQQSIIQDLKARIETLEAK
jgi:hypothetical protein